MPLAKWDIIYAYCEHIVPPKDKFCICICPRRNWFLFINSEPPRARRAQQYAIEVNRQELHVLHHTSYIDSTYIYQVHTSLVEKALGDEQRRKGCVSPTLRKKIQAAVKDHGALTPEETQAVLLDS